MIAMMTEKSGIAAPGSSSATSLRAGSDLIASLFEVAGKKAVVTGGAGDIGRALAGALTESGASVVIIGRSKSTNDVARTLGAIPLLADLSNRDDLERGFHDAVTALGGIDILITAHGTVRGGAALETSFVHWEETLATNLSSVFELARLAGMQMTRQSSGKIITIASMLSFSGGYRAAAYAASKGGVAQLTKALANEWAPVGVNVNAIAPGYIKTKLNAHVWQDDRRCAEILARLPAGRWGVPDDLIGAALFLCSHASDYLHGAILPVDGGWLAR
jgi:2-deoxy-D-gluconate 3-dehydrogenase